MLLALALIVLVLVGASAKQADAATKLVTKTFSNTGLITIPDGSAYAPPPGECTGTTVGTAAPYPSERTVGAFPSGSHIRDINLTLKNYSDNDGPDDVDVMLAHSGRNRTVMSDVGGGQFVDNISLVLNDEATRVLPDTNTVTLVGGGWRPHNYERDDFFPSPAPTQDTHSALSGFDGQNPNNTWKLFVRDDFSFDCGKFGGGWSITIKAAVPA
jgi:hypothetical protein